MIASDARIEFTLSFDNYLDVYERTPKKGRPKFLRSLLVLASVVIFVGFLFAHQDPQLDSVAAPGALTVSISVYLFVFCLPLWFFLYKPKPSKNLERSRENYENYFTEPRAIEFAESGWKYCYGGSANSGPWTALHSLAKLGNTFVIADAFVQYFIPAECWHHSGAAGFVVLSGGRKRSCQLNPSTAVRAPVACSGPSATSSSPPGNNPLSFGSFLKKVAAIGSATSSTAPPRWLPPTSHKRSEDADYSDCLRNSASDRRQLTCRPGLTP